MAPNPLTRAFRASGKRKIRKKTQTVWMELPLYTGPLWEPGGEWGGYIGWGLVLTICFDT